MFFNKNKIKANFNQAQPSYNSNALLQKMVAKNLVLRARENIINSQNIIDLGSGTGFVAQEILAEFMDKKIIQLDIAQKMLTQNSLATAKIIADIEILPLRENIFDLALSSLSFQWLNDLEKTIMQVLKTLKNDGNFYFSLLGNESLKELKTICQNFQIPLSINEFIDHQQLEKILHNLNLDYQINSQIIQLDYQDCYDLLKSIKSIGAGYSSNQKYLGKKQFDLLNSFYLKNFNLNNKVFATWQILYVSIKNRR
ncbi:MAG: methyltransferase domain-containing protein [Pseudomonadota bacterium]